MATNGGVLQLVKNGDIRPAFNFTINETCTIGTQPKCNIRLKVQTSVPECSVFKTDSRGYTEFLSNGISNCQVNNKLFKGVKYLIPGDVLLLFGKKFIYQNPNLSEEVISMLQNENRKLFCREKLKDRTNTKRHTMFMRKNAIRGCISIKGSRTPGPKCTYNIYANDFMVEDIENHPVTPSTTSSNEIVQRNRFTNIFNTPQYNKNSDDNHFSFVQYQEINVQIGGSSNSSGTPKRKSKFSLSSINDQPPDLIPIEEIANSAEDVTMINDVSDPFSEITPETGLEPHSNDSSPVRTHNLASQQKQDDNVAEHGSDCCNDEMDNFDESLRISSDGIKGNAKKTPTLIFDEVADNPSDVEQCSPKTSIKTGMKTPKSAVRLANNSNVIEATPTYVRITTRASMTPDPKTFRFSVAADDQSPKTPLSGKKILNESTNIMQQVVVESDNSIKKIPYTEESIFPAVTPPRRYSERIVATRRNSELSTTRRSEIINKTVQAENLQNQAHQLIRTESASSKHSTSSGSIRRSSSGSSLAVLINDANITKRRSQKPSAATSPQVFRNNEDILEEDDVALGEDVVLEEDVEYSSGSSSGHYDSDRENVNDERCTKLSGIESLEKSVLESPSRNVAVNYSQILKDINNSSNTDEMYHSLSDREENREDESEIFSSESSVSYVDNNENDTTEIGDSTRRKRGVKRSRSQMESPHTSGNRIKRRHPSTNDLTDLDAIKDLLDIPPDAQSQSFNESTHYESIKDLLDISTQSEDSSVDGKTSVTSKTDLTQNRETRRSFVVPQSPQNKEEDVIVIRTPRPQNRISRTPKTPQKSRQTIYKDTPRPQTPQQDTPILRRSLRTPKPRKSPGCDSPEHKDVKTITPRPQKTPIRKPQIPRPVSEVKIVRSILKTPTNRNRSLSEDILLDTRTPKLQKTQADNISGRGSVLKTPRSQSKSVSDLSDVLDVKQQVETPKPQKTPKKSLSNLKGDTTTTPKIQDESQSDSSDGQGVTRVTQTPKPQKTDIDNVSGRKTPKSRNKSLNDVPDVVDVLEEVETPKPQKTPKKSLNNLKRTPKTQDQPQNDSSDRQGVTRITQTLKPQKSPKNDLSDVKGVKSILKTPKTQNQPNNDLTDVRGVKKLLATPKVQKPPKNDLSDVDGVKSILKTPKVQNPPKNDLSDIKGVKKLMATPKPQNPPRNDLSDLKGVRTLMRTPGARKEPNNDLSDVKGVKKLMTTPKAQKSPKNDLSDIKGVKKLMTTPKTQRQPENDLSDVRGVKTLMSTPKVQKEPANDLTDVRGVKTLLTTPKVQNQPKNDLSDIKGVKKLMTTPKLPQKSPKNDLSDVRGVKKLLTTPKIPQKPPKNDLTDVRGVKDLFKILEDNNRPEINYDGLKELFRNDSSLELENDNRDPFDKLIDKKSYRTYKAKSISPKEKGLVTSKQDVSPSLLEWVEDQSKRLEIAETVSKTKSTRSNARNKKKREKESETETSVIEETIRRPVRRTRRNATASSDNQQQEIASVAAPSTRSRGRQRKNDESEVEDVVSVRSTRSRGKRRKEEIETSEDNDESAVVVRATRGRNKRDSEESSVVEDNLTVRKTRSGGRQPKKSEEIFKTPNLRKHNTSTPLKTEDKNKQSDESEEGVEKPDKRPTGKAAKNTRGKKRVVVDESDELTGEESRTIDTSSNNSVHETERGTRTRARAKPIQEKITPPKTRGGRSKQKAADEDVSSNKKGTKSATKRTLYDPESEVVALSVSKESAVEEAQSPLRKGRTRSNRNVNLPRMLQEFEHNLSKNTKTETKAVPKSGRGKRKAVVETEPVGRVTRSKRTKT